MSEQQRLAFECRPNPSKYHGVLGFDLERFLIDYAEWEIRATPFFSASPTPPPTVKERPMSTNPPNSTPVLDHGFVAPILQPDSDLKVVNAARVSFHKESEWVVMPTAQRHPETPELRRRMDALAGPGSSMPPVMAHCLSDKDAGLIQYLAKHKHWTPFAHSRAVFMPPEAWMNRNGRYWQLPDPVRMSLEYVRSSDGTADYFSFSLFHCAHIPEIVEHFRALTPVAVTALAPVVGDIPVEDRFVFIPTLPASRLGRRHVLGDLLPATLHIKLPIFVDRQLVTHKVGFVRNEVSRRYVDEPPEFHTPTTWRSRPDKSIKQGSGGPLPPDEQGVTTVEYQDALAMCHDRYNVMLKMDGAPEQARIVLPLSTYTEHWTTASLRSWARLFRLRSDPHAQQEIREYAAAIDSCLSTMHPDHWPRIRDTQ